MIPALCSRNLVATQGIYFAVPSTFSKHGVYFLRCATNSKEELLNSFLFIHALKKYGLWSSATITSAWLPDSMPLIKKKVIHTMVQSRKDQ